MHHKTNLQLITELATFMELTFVKSTRLFALFQVNIKVIPTVITNRRKFE